MDEKLFDETLVGEVLTSADSVDTKSAEEASENIALKRALERVKRDAEAQLHAGHHTHHNSHSAHNTCLII